MNEITSKTTLDNETNLIIPQAAAIQSTIVVSAGEMVTDVTVNSGAEMIVSSGGSSTYITLNGGVQYVSSGGVDEGAIVYTGSQYIYSGGTTMNTSIYSNGVQYVSGGVTSDGTVMSGGNQYIYSGSIASYDVSGTQYIYGGSVSNITVNNAQYISGGNVFSGTVTSGGNQYIYSGSVASYNVSGTQYIYGGSVSNISVLNGFQYIYGGIVSNITVFGGSQTIVDGEVHGINLNNNAFLCISGGIIEGLIANDGNHVISGGILSDIWLNSGTEYVYGGGVVSGGTIRGGTQQYVIGGTVTDVSIEPGQLYNGEISNSISGIYDYTWFPTTIQVISAGGIVNNFTMNAYTETSRGMTPGGGAGMHGIYTFYYPSEQFVKDGGVVNGGTIFGGNQYIEAGATVNDVILKGSLYTESNTSLERESTALQYVSSGGLANGTVIIDGMQYISSGATASNTVISSSDGMQVVNGAAYDTIVIGGSQRIEVGAVASNITIQQGGKTEVFGTVKGSIALSSGGILTIQSGGILGGNVVLNPGGSMTIGLLNGGSVDLIGNSNSGLIISGYIAGLNNNVTTVISGFSGLGTGLSDKVTIDGLQAANISAVTYPDDNHIMLKLLDGTSLTLNMPGIKQTGYSLGSDVNGNLTVVVCFLSGTMIKMATGDCAVEDIEVGDTVFTYDPQSKAKVKKIVTWIGKKMTHVNPNLSDDLAGYPVRVLKNTFTKGVPNKDLLITPEHCLFIDGHFIPVRMLVNGRSIFYDYSITEYDYYHIETEDHSIIWADGMMTESYLNTGNRHQFNRDEKVVTLERQAKSWEDDAVVSLRVERSFVEPIFNRLVKRANQQRLLLQNECNFTLCNDHGLYLLTEDGEQIRQSRVEKDQIIFVLPANTQGIYLVSKKSRFFDSIGPFVDDRRHLGVLVGKVCVLNEYGSYPITHYLKEMGLQGWSVVEQEQCRWTMGCALLPLDEYNIENDFEISIQVLAGGPYLVKNPKDEEKRIAG